MNRRDAIAALVGLPAVARISVADLKPEDILVVECEGHLTTETAERLKVTLHQVWPGRKALVMDSGMRLKVFAG